MKKRPFIKGIVILEKPEVFKNRTHDCVIVALSRLLGISYETVNDDLKNCFCEGQGMYLEGWFPYLAERCILKEIVYYNSGRYLIDNILYGLNSNIELENMKRVKNPENITSLTNLLKSGLKGTYLVIITGHISVYYDGLMYDSQKLIDDEIWGLFKIEDIS